MEPMKNYRQLIKELPSKKVVMAFGRFQPPTTGHELLVNAVKKIAQKQGADHIIFASRTQDKKSNPLPVDRKVYYLKRMFPNTNFVAANEEIRTFIEAAKSLSKKYKNLVMLAGSDRVPEYKRLLERYNGDVFHFDTVEVVSAGERDPDADTASGMSGTKMREAAKKGDFTMFKKGLPHTLTEIDGKRLMNEIRQGLGMEAIKEQVKFEVSDLREQYHAGEIFKLEEIVESNGTVYQIKKRGSNHLLLQDEAGNLVSKWLDDVQQTTKEYKLQEGLNEMKFSSSDKIKVARVIATALGVEDVEKSSNPEQLVNTALRKVRSKPMRPEYIGVLHNMLQTAKEADIKFDEKLVPQKANEATEYWKKPSWQKKMADAAKRERLAREKKEKEAQSQVKEEEILEYEIHHDGKGNYRDDEGNEWTSKTGSAHHSSFGRRHTITSNVPHSVHINGKKWKTFGSQSHAQNVANKIKGATVHKEEVELDEAKTISAAQFVKNLIKKNTKIRDAEGVSDPMPEPDETLGGDNNVPKGNEPDQDEVVGTEAPDHTEVGHSLAPGASPQQRRMKVAYVHEEAEEQESDAEEDKELGKELDSITDKEMDKMADEIDTEEDILDVYDDHELAIVDDETGEHIEDVEDEDKKEVKEETINEVLSRIERMKAKTRFAKTKAKRERKARIALKSRSSSETINKRARRLAVNLMKQRLARKPLAQLSVGEKERLERVIKKRKAIVNRLAMKLAPRVRKIESTRLAHKTYTK